MHICKSSLALHISLIQVFMCCMLWHLLLCLRICSLSGALRKVWNERYNILQFINTYPCLASQPISTLTPTTSKSHVHFHPCASIFLLRSPSYFKKYILRTAPGQPSSMSSFGSNKCTLAGRPDLHRGREKVHSSTENLLHTVRVLCKAA